MRGRTVGLQSLLEGYWDCRHGKGAAIRRQDAAGLMEPIEQALKVANHRKFVAGRITAGTAPPAAIPTG